MSTHLGLTGWTPKLFINTMKKFLLAATVLMASVVANAQNEVGQISIAPTVGINLSNVTKLENTQMKFGIAAGAVAEYGVSENFGVSLGLIYSQQGCKFKGVTEVIDVWDDELEDYVEVSETIGKGKMNLGYLNIPILAQYYVVDGLAIKAGIQPAVLVSAKSYGEKYKKYCNTFEVSIPVGLSYEISNFVIDARYNIGLTKIPKKKYSNAKANNSVFQFTVGYKFKL